MSRVKVSVHLNSPRLTQVSQGTLLEGNTLSNVYSVKTYLSPPEAARQSSHILRSPVVNEAFEELQMPGNATHTGARIHTHADS